MENVLLQAIERLETVLLTETRALKSGAALDLAQMAGRKNQSLLEMSRLSRSITREQLSPPARARLDGLKANLSENQRVLSLHVAASRDLSELISESIRQAESDGTYDSSRPREGRSA